MEVKVDLSDAPVVIPRTGPAKEMISVTREGNRTKVRINSSSHGIIQECLRKGQYSLYEGWRSMHESPPTLFGSAIHAALEVFYQGLPEERILPSLDSLEILAYSPMPKNAGLIERSVGAFVRKAEPLRPLQDSDKRSLSNGIWILYHYFKTHINDPYVAYVDDRGPFVERQFTLRLYEDKELIIDYFGTIDIAFKHVSSGLVIPGDHKTTSILSGYGESASYFDREKPNHQYTGYLLGARKCFGIDSYDFLVNVIEVKAKPKTSKGSAPSFPRQVTSRDEEDFKEFRDSVIISVGDYLAAIETGIWPLGHVNACSMYTGCQYRQVCASPKSLRETILNAKFTKEAK